VVSVFLSFMGLSGLFGKRNISALDVTLELPGEMYANRPAPITVRVRNRKKFLPGFLLWVIAGEHRILFPYVDPESASVRHLTFSAAHRGRLTLGKVHVCSVFPFNFFVRCRKAGDESEGIVFPEPKQCDPGVVFGKQNRARGEQYSDRTGFDSDTISIRDYAQGDPMKYISWKATAKTGELKTRELSSLSDQPVLIDFDEVSARDGEERISFVTYMILNLLRKNVPVGLKLHQTIFRPAVSVAHKVALLTELARYGTEE
jgi:uncharacterized protein (DUF58 family)